MIDDYVHFFDKGSLGETTCNDLLSKPYHGFYRPVPFTILKAVFSIVQDNAVGYHLFNLILFYAVCWMFYVIIAGLSKNHVLALLASGLYAVHPINAMLVNYKTASNNSVFVLCMQFSAWLLIKYADKKNRAWFVGSLVFYFLSLLSHEVSFILPLYLLAILFFLRPREPGKNFCLASLYALPLIVFTAIRLQILGPKTMAGVFQLGLDAVHLVRIWGSLISWYLSKMVFPRDILFLWEEDIRQLSPAWNDMTIAGIFVLMVLVLLVKGRSPVKFLGAVILSLGFIPLIPACFTYTATASQPTAIIEPHWFGFSSIGFFLIVADTLCDMRKVIDVKIWTAGTAAFFIFLALFTRSGNADWKDEQTYCLKWLRLNALNGESWNSLARSYRRVHDHGLQKAAYKNCEEVSYVALTYHVNNQAQPSFEYYQLALAMNPECASAYYGLGILFSSLENEEEAHFAFETARRLDGRYVPVVTKLKEAFDNQRTKKTAVELQERMTNSGLWPLP